MREWTLEEMAALSVEVRKSRDSWQMLFTDDTAEPSQAVFMAEVADSVPDSAAVVMLWQQAMRFFTGQVEARLADMVGQPMAPGRLYVACKECGEEIIANLHICEPV